MESPFYSPLCYYLDNLLGMMKMALMEEGLALLGWDTRFLFKNIQFKH